MRDAYGIWFKAICPLQEKSLLVNIIIKVESMVATLVVHPAENGSVGT
jgi:hypothetical protein